MKILMLFILPLIIILLSAVISTGLSHNVRLSHNLGLIGILSAFITNILIIYYQAYFSQIISSYITYQLTNLWIQAFLLFIFLTFNLSNYPNIKGSHNIDLLYGAEFLLFACIYSLFYVENVLYLTLLFISIFFLTDYLFWFGSKQKKENVLNFSKIKNISASVFLISLNFLIYQWVGDFSLDKLQSVIPTLSTFKQLILFFGVILVAILFLDFGPLSYFEHHTYYGQSNIFHLRFMQTMVIPCGLFYLVRLLVYSFHSNMIIGLICLIFGIFGITFSTTRLIMELYKFNVKRSQNLMKIMGYTYTLQVNFLWFLISFYHLFTNYDFSQYSAVIIVYFLILITSSMIFWEAINPLTFSTQKLSLSELNHIGKFFPNFIIIFVMIVFYNFGPGFPGFFYLREFLDITFSSVSILNILSGIKWVLIIFYFFIYIFLPVTIGTIIVNVYQISRKKDEDRSSNQIPIISLQEYIFAPILVIGMIILQIIFLSSITELQTFFI